MFRVYCHTAARDGGELCVVLKYGSAAEATGSTVEAAAAKFCQAHNRRCEKAGLADRIALGTRHNVEFDVPPAEFRNRCDVNVTVTALFPPSAEAPVPAAPAAGGVMPGKNENAALTSAPDSAAAAAAAQEKKKEKKKPHLGQQTQTEESTRC